MMSQFKLLLIILLCRSGWSLACPLVDTSPVSAALAPSLVGAEPRRVVISSNNTLALPPADGVLIMRSEDTQALLDSIEHWPTSSGTIASINAQPVVVDSNYDGVADALYAVDVNGLVWFIAFDRQRFTAPELIADFSGTGYRFEQPLQLLQTLSPEASGHLRYHSMLLLTASDNAKSSVLIALKHRSERVTPATLTQLIDRSQIDAEEVRYGIDEQLWTRLSAGDGWFVQLGRQINIKPQIYAGVVYFTSVKSGFINADCSLASDAEPTLHALHLHHAGLVYQQRQQVINPTASGDLALVRSDSGELQLVLHQPESTLVLQTDLVAVSEECADCTTALDTQPFPRLIRLATFQHEYGAH